MFGSGQIIGTATFISAMEAAYGENAQKEIVSMLRRHLTGDWGDTCPEDTKANERAVKSGERILSIYHPANFKVYIITEWDRSATTVMLASDY